MAKNSYNVYFLPMVQTKASELSDIPGVNTPLNESSESIIQLPIHKDSQKLHS